MALRQLGLEEDLLQLLPAPPSEDMGKMTSFHTFSSSLKLIISPKSPLRTVASQIKLKV